MFFAKPPHFSHCVVDFFALVSTNAQRFSAAAKGHVVSRLACMVLLLLGGLSGAPGALAATCDFTFTTSTSNATITRCADAVPPVLDIPATVTIVTNGSSFAFTVTGIGTNAFQSKTLTSVTIGNGLTTIEERVFLGNSISTLTLGNSLTSIGPQTFQSNQLTSLKIPDSVTSIENNAFRYNLLKNVTLGNNVTTIGDDAFNGNQISNLEIPDSVTSIGTFAFRYNAISTLRLPHFLGPLC